MTEPATPPQSVSTPHTSTPGTSTPPTLKPWRADWADRLRGQGCVLCELIGVSETSWGARVFEGRYVDAYLPRSGVITGYTVAVWKSGHVAEPTQLSQDEAAGYWLEVLHVGRALEHAFEHAKMNYQSLGNTVPHLHTHVIPRPPLDPAPNAPLPWSYLDEGRQDETAFADAVDRLRASFLDDRSSR